MPGALYAPPARVGGIGPAELVRGGPLCPGYVGPGPRAVAAAKCLALCPAYVGSQLWGRGVLISADLEGRTGCSAPLREGRGSRCGACDGGLLFMPPVCLETCRECGATRPGTAAPVRGRAAWAVPPSGFSAMKDHRADGGGRHEPGGCRGLTRLGPQHFTNLTIGHVQVFAFYLPGR